MCSVFLYEEARTINIAAEHLAPVEPARGDKVKVILGDEDREMTGQLLSIDSQVSFFLKNHWVMGICGFVPGHSHILQCQAK